MTIRVAWDKAETALLIDAYIKVESGQLPMKDVVSSLSHQLRQRALHVGTEVDNVFRNENGIDIQIRKIQFLMTEGKLGLDSTSKLFREMVRLYKEDHLTFQKILSEAKTQIESMNHSKDIFIGWLSKQTTQSKVTEVQFVLIELEKYAKSKNLLKTPLLDSFSLETIKKIHKSLQNNFFARLLYKDKYNKMLEACSIYLEYLRFAAEPTEEGLEVQDTSTKRRVDEDIIDVNPPIQFKEDKQDKNSSTSTSPNLMLQEDFVSVEEFQDKAHYTERIDVGDTSEPMTSAEPASENDFDVEYTFVNFLEAKSYSFTTPLFIHYYGDHFKVNNWTGVYVQLLSCLYDNHPDKIQRFIRKSRLQKESIWLGDESQIRKMIRPVQFTKGMYAEVNLGANAIVRRMQKLLELCTVDSNQVKIAYRKEGQASSTFRMTSQYETKNQNSSLQAIDFINWMTEQRYTLSTTNSYLSSLRSIDRYITQTKLSKHRLLVTKSVDEVIAIQEALLKDKGFVMMNAQQNNRFRQALLRYVEFVSDVMSPNHYVGENEAVSNINSDTSDRIGEYTFGHSLRVENQDNTPHDSDECEMVSNPLHAILHQMNLSFTDNRSSGGNLWIVGDYSFNPVINHLRDLGLHFRYREEGGRVTQGKSAWWTSDFLAEEVSDEQMVPTARLQKPHYLEETSKPLPSKLIIQIKAIIPPIAKPVNDSPLLQMLSEHFPKGFRTDSIIDIKRFRVQWKRQFVTDLAMDDAMLQQKLQDVGVAHNGLIYHLDRMLSLEKRQELLSLIHQWITIEYRIPIYYEALYQAVLSLLHGEGITSPEMLRSCLVAINPGYYRPEKEYLSIQDRTYDNCSDSVLNFLYDQGKPMKVDEIQKEMPHLTQDIIRSVLKGSTSIINSGANEYFHFLIIDFSSDNVEELTRITQLEIDENYYISGNQLVGLLRERAPQIMDPYTHISEVGMRKVLSIWMGDRFCFNGNLVSALGKELSISDIYLHYCQKHDSFSLQDLYSLRDSIGQNPRVYLDVVYDNALRISEEQFVSKEKAHFNINSIDAAISLFCRGDYASLNAISSFSAFPDVGYPWNAFMLEHFVYAYSKEYRLVHSGFRASQSNGAIVKKDAPYTELCEVLIHDLANSRIALDREEALDYFVQKGYIARMRLAGIEDILSAAINIRNKRG